MRLICPNCDAQYEVPDEVMPTSGRDVQCSNCGQTWFQHHPDHMPEDDPDAGEDARPTPDEDIAPPPPQMPPAKPAPERKQLDPSVADILRQEAEAEQEARRRRQADALESQPDLGLEGADTPSQEVRTKQAEARMARLRGEDSRPVSEAKTTAAAIGSRRDLLPDIEEINSSLRTGSERRPVGMRDDLGDETLQTGSGERKGFRRGFLFVVLLAVVLMLVYGSAPEIAKAVPQVDPYLSAYVAWMDGIRLSLDQALQGALQWLDVKASQSSTN